jgi:hypothetical protein
MARFAMASAMASAMAALAVAVVAGSASAQQVANAPNPNGAGRPAAVDAPNSVSHNAIRSSLIFRNASYATGGVGLRNRGVAGITIAGVTGPVKAAYVYWAVITDGAPTAANTTLTVGRDAPSGSTTSPVTALVSGTQVGTGGTPCWGGTAITVFRGAVPVSVASGAGAYTVTLNAGASGLTNGADPRTASVVYPLMEGASLVLIGQGAGTVALYDAGLAGQTFGCVGARKFNYSLSLPVAADGGSVWLDNIAADGQSYLGNKTTTVNGTLIAGPGSVLGDSDWNGRAGGNSPQLWDDTGHDITAAVGQGATTLNIDVVPLPQSGGLPDGLTPVANIVSVQ